MLGGVEGIPEGRWGVDEVVVMMEEEQQFVCRLHLSSRRALGEDEVEGAEVWCRQLNVRWAARGRRAPPGAPNPCTCLALAASLS